jgi:hypothetical protein
MKKWVLLCFFVCLNAMICFADGVNGRWAGTIGLVYDVTVSIKDDNGKISGTVTTEIGDIPLKDGTINGADITFKPFSYNGIAVSYVKGKLDGDKMNVTVGFQGTSFTGTLKRLK